MFRNMKHDRCRISVEETGNYLREENWGVLSLHGDDGFPYGVPMNYVWDNGSILLHCASGNSHRLDSLKDAEQEGHSSKMEELRQSSRYRDFPFQ